MVEFVFFGIGMIVGVIGGIFTLALCVISKKADEDLGIEE